MSLCSKSLCFLGLLCKIVRMNKKSIILGVLIVVVAGMAFSLYRKSIALRADPQLVAQNELATLVARVGKLILLPEGETPVLATVEDPAKLKDQAFFAKAKVGDKVLLYQKMKKAYLYDPEANRIMEVAPIVLDVGKDFKPKVAK